MRLLKTGAVCALALSFAACGGGDRPGDTAVRDTIGTAPGAVTPGTTTPGAPGTGQMAGGERVELRPLAGSNVSGEATLTPGTNNTQVMVRLTGGQAGQKAGHIHRGTCDNIGPVAFPLEPVNAQQGGTSTSTINATAEQLMDGQHVIAYHEAGGNPGSPVTCGELRGTGMGVGGTGVGTGTTGTGTTGTTRP